MGRGRGAQRLLKLLRHAPPTRDRLFVFQAKDGLSSITTPDRTLHQLQLYLADDPEKALLRDWMALISDAGRVQLPRAADSTPAELTTLRR